MGYNDTEPFIARGLRHLVAALGGRMEFAARFERPVEALARDYFAERRRDLEERRDFERAWTPY